MYSVYLRFMTDTKPLKRSEQLAPLSREHHDGLLFVWKIRTGLKNGTDPGTLKQYTSWYWQNHLESHLETEEEVLLTFLPSKSEMGQRIRSEHESIRELASNAAKIDVNDLAMLADKLSDHIRFEERQLFNHLEETLSTEQLNSIYLKLNHEQVCSVEWKEEFWNKK